MQELSVQSAVSSQYLVSGKQTFRIAASTCSLVKLAQSLCSLSPLTARPEIENISNLSVRSGGWRGRRGPWGPRGLGQQESGLGQSQSQDPGCQVSLPLSGGESPSLLLSQAAHLSYLPPHSLEPQEQLSLLFLKEPQPLGT